MSSSFTLIIHKNYIFLYLSFLIPVLLLSLNTLERVWFHAAHDAESYGFLLEATSDAVPTQ